MRGSAIAWALLLAGCGGGLRASARIETEHTPPAPPSATLDPGPSPYDGAAWVDGHWEWDGLQFVWVDGYWIDSHGATVRQPAWTGAAGSWSYDGGALVEADGSSSALPAPPHATGAGRAGGTVIAVPGG